MRRLLSLLIFSVPLISYADTDEVPLEEDEDNHTILRRIDVK